MRSSGSACLNSRAIKQGYLCRKKLHADYATNIAVNLKTDFYVCVANMISIIRWVKKPELFLINIGKLLRFYILIPMKSVGFWSAILG